jgi:hypothetical protein
MSRKNRNNRNNRNNNMMMGGAKMPAVGSKLQVWNGNAKHTSGGLTRKDLMRTKHGRIVSRRKHAAGQKAIKNLRRAGYVAKKGTFKLFQKKRGGSESFDDMEPKMGGRRSESAMEPKMGGRRSESFMNMMKGGRRSESTAGFESGDASKLADLLANLPKA